MVLFKGSKVIRKKSPEFYRITEQQTHYENSLIKHYKNSRKNQQKLSGLTGTFVWEGNDICHSEDLSVKLSFS